MNKMEDITLYVSYNVDFLSILSTMLPFRITKTYVRYEKAFAGINVLFEPP